MRILITNDDGMHATQLVPLIQWCQKLGDITTVVPKVEQSGKSHGIELRTAFEAKQVELAPGITAWAVDSTPADCVRFAVMGLHKEFDLVISGVNRALMVYCPRYSNKVNSPYAKSWQGATRGLFFLRSPLAFTVNLPCLGLSSVSRAS